MANRERQRWGCAVLWLIGLVLASWVARDWIIWYVATAVPAYLLLVVVQGAGDPPNPLTGRGSARGGRRGGSP